MSLDLLGPDPIAAFFRWFDEAKKAPEITMPDVMALATATPDGAPSVRFVLLRPPAKEAPFSFFTNYESRKADELAANPRGALAIHWESLGRQVRIEGPVEKLSAEQSDVYFYSRARGSQIGAWVSRQSRSSADREDLERRFAEAESLFDQREVKRPPHWGGYQVIASLIEFWEARPNRLHDRMRYERDADGRWRTTRLDP
jgi:pyridoxamine 5'-phosphate oxidase